MQSENHSLVAVADMFYNEGFKWQQSEQCA